MLEGEAGAGAEAGVLGCGSPLGCAEADGTSDRGAEGVAEVSEDRPPVDLKTNVPHIARVYDYWLGGKNNYPVDRAMSEKLVAVMPDGPKTAQANRRFLIRAVHLLTAELGIRQFLDIGTGLPTVNNTHEVAQEAAPESRIVYVDNDPLVLVHAQALLTSTPEGACDYLDADVRDPETILERARATLDFGKPVAVMLVGLLHCVPDDEDLPRVVRTLMDATVAGSYLVVSHPASDIGDAMASASSEASREMEPITARDYQAVAALFDGLELLEPGVVPVTAWRAGSGIAPAPLPVWAGVGRKL